MPFFNFKCCECHASYKVFIEPDDKRIQVCLCGKTLTKVIGSTINKKNENPPFQTAEDCIEDSRSEVLKELENFKESYKSWKP